MLNHANLAKPRKMNTYKIAELKVFRMNTCINTGAPVGRAKIYLLPRKGHQQDALFAVNRAELLRVNKGPRRATAANVVLAANVYQQDQLRGVKKSGRGGI
jgi:hypothetical protein